MKIIKLIIMTLALLICGVTGYSQKVAVDTATPKTYRDMIFQQSSYIFEGTLISGEPALRPLAPYGSYCRNPYIKKIKITNIFKNPDGKLKLGTIQVIDYSRNYRVDEQGNFYIQDVIDGGSPFPDNGIYFCIKHDSTINQTGIDNNAILLKQICGVDLRIGDIYDENHLAFVNPFYGFKAFGLNYSSNKDFYNEIKHYPNVTIPDSLLDPPVPVEEPVKYKKMYRKDNNGKMVLDSIPVILPQKKSPIDNELNLVKPKIIIDTSSILNSIKIKASGANLKSGHSKHIEDIELTLQIENANVTGTYPYFYLNFDLYINANGPGFFLDNILMNFAYSSGLGTSIAGSVGVMINPAFYDSTADWQPLADITSQIFSFEYGSNTMLSAWTRNEIPQTPSQIFNFNIPVFECTDTVSIGFTNTGSTALDNFFTNNFDDGISSATLFDATSYLPTNPYEDLPCIPAPVITSFTDTLLAGDYYQNNPMNLSNMVITGLNFGATQGSGNVYFPNADVGGIGGPVLPLDGYDIQSWSDTMITLTVPGMIQSVAKIPMPGSGTFAVLANSGQSVYSTGVQTGGVYFRYAILNKSIPTPYTKLRQDIGKIHATDTTVTFLLDTSITNYASTNPMFIPMIKKALADWVCETQVNYTIGGVDTVNDIGNQNVSLIYFTDTLPANVLAETNPATITCTNAVNPLISYKVARGFQIAILRTPATVTHPAYFWWFDTLSTVNDSVPKNGFDMLRLLHHEFGHTISQGHITDLYDVMYYAQKPGIYQNWYRGWIKQFWNAIGAIDVDRKSALFNNYSGSCGGFELPLAAFSVCLPDEDLVPTINPYVFNLKIFPNPLNENLLNIAYTLKQDSPVKFEVLDITGREVLSLNENSNAGEHTDQLNLDNIASGIYLIKIIIGDTQDTQKLIKLR